MTITANDFWAQFKLQVAAAQPSGYGGAWTVGMYDVLHRVQRHFGVWCQCKVHPKSQQRDGRSGERMGIDFTWFPMTGSEWIAPLVAIEHENLWTDIARSVDHWKVNQIAASLRVFIGYVQGAQHVLPAAQELMSQEGEWTPVRLGRPQGMIILGHGGMTPADFSAWVCEQGDTQSWRKLT